MTDRSSDKRTGGDTGTATTLNPGDTARPGTRGTGEAICPECGGSGRKAAQTCPACGGTGKVIEGIGGA
jgi:DnaJ-class molecular chaperone